MTRELDAQVAEEVMGWKVNRDTWRVRKPHSDKENTYWDVPLTAGEWGAFNPSTRIQDAKLVWEKMGNNGYCIEIVNDLVAWSVVFTHIDSGNKYTADWKNSLEAQVCLAALEAVSHE